MALWQWSTTPANNASAGAIDWAEGQPPSTVNDSARQMMADVAQALMTDREWINFGLTPTFVSGTQFTVTGNQTGIYSVGRRVRIFVTAGTIYGSITASVFTSLTTVSVSLDTGSLDSGISEVDVGILNPAHGSIGDITLPGAFLRLGTAAFNSQPQLSIRNSNRTVHFFLSTDGTQFGLFDDNSSANRWVSDTAGNFSVPGSLAAGGSITAGGNITANSDERLKEDWGVLDADFVGRLAAVRSGTYTRVDSGQRHVGVGAQSLQALLPEAVIESEKGILSVAYGQAALAACVELAKEVVRLRALVEAK
jgi:hypothetical protein